jgi:hypothetical protein
VCVESRRRLDGRHGQIPAATRVSAVPSFVSFLYSNDATPSKSPMEQLYENMSALAFSCSGIVKER